MSIQLTEKHFVSIIHDGLLKNIREKAISNIMNTLEKDVTAAVDEALSDMKGYVGYYYSDSYGEPIYQIAINGVPYKEPAGT